MTTILTGTIIDAYEAAKELKENQKNSSDYIASYSCDYIASYSCDYIASYSCDYIASYSCDYIASYSCDYIASYSCDYIASYSCDYIASYSIAKLWMSKRKTKDVASASEYKLKLFLIIYYFIINSKLEKNIRITNIHRCKYYVKLFSYLHII